MILENLTATGEIVWTIAIILVFIITGLVTFLGIRENRKNKKQDLKGKTT